MGVGFEVLWERAWAALDDLRPTDAERLLAELRTVPLAEDDPRRAEVALLEVELDEWRGRRAAARDGGARLVAEARRHGWAAAQAHALVQLARLAADEDTVRWEPLLLEALAVAPEGHPVRDEARSYLRRVLALHGREGELPQSGEGPHGWFERERLRILGRQRAGDLADGLALAEQLLAATRTARDRGKALIVVANAALLARRLERAEEAARQVLSLEVSVHFRLHARILVAEVARLRGQHEVAAEQNRILEEDAAAGFPNVARDARANRILSLLLLERWDEALALAEPLLARVRDSAFEGPARMLVVAALAGRGDAGTAARHVVAALRLIARDRVVNVDLAASARIAADAWRRTPSPERLAIAVRCRILARTQAAALSTAPPTAEDAALRALRQAGAPIPAGAFDLWDVLGRGAMGEVWSATHALRGTAAAVKLLRTPSPRHEALFDAEIRAVARLSHPHVVRILGLGALGPEAEVLGARAGATWFAMERLDGGALLDRCGHLEWDEARDLLRAILGALAHAHARGVLHLDLKPENVRFDAAGRPVLTDFGLAGVAAATVRTTAGTPAYMSPEQWRGDVAALGPWTDLYALGCMARHLLTGRPPFEGDLAQLREQHLGVPPPSLGGAPVEPWLRRLMAKWPADRFASAAEAADALAGIDRAGVAHGPASSGSATFATLDLDADGPAEASAPPAPQPRRKLPDWRADRPDEVESLELFGLRRVPLVGLVEQRDRLWTALRAAVSEGRALHVLICGPPGSGKSALARWLTESAHEAGAGVDLAITESRDPAAAPDPGAVVVHLPAPDAPALRRLLRTALPLASGTVAELVAIAGNDAGFALALVADLVVRDALVPGDDGLVRAPGSPALPPEASELLRRRAARALTGLDDEGRRAARVLALAGASVAGAAVDRLGAAGERAVAVLRRDDLVRPTSDGRFAWVDPHLPTAVLGGPPSDEDRLLAASVLADVDPGRTGELLLEAGRTADAAEALLAGAWQASARRDHAALRTLVDRYAEALVLLGTPASGARWHPERMFRALLAGVELRHDEAAALAAEAAELARGAGQTFQEADVSYYAGMQLRLGGRVTEADRALLHAADRFAAAGRPDRALEAVLYAGQMHRSVGDADAAERAFRRALPAGRAAIGLACVALDRGDRDAADRWVQGGLETLLREGDREGLNDARLLLGDVARRQGDLDAAERWYEAVLADGPDPDTVHLARIDLVLVRYARGELERGAAEVEALHDHAVGSVTARLWITALRTVPRSVGPDGPWVDHVRDLQRVLGSSGFRDDDVDAVLELAAARAEAAGLPDRALALRSL